jgi:tetratricopeptide (TPR) repeat protein
VKRKIYNLVEKGAHGSTINLIFDYFIVSLIILNVIAISLDTLTGIDSSFKRFLHIFEILSILIFSLEFAMRIYVSEDFNMIIELRPDDHAALSGRGSAKLELKDYFGALQDFNKAIESDPKDAWAYRNRGLAKNNLNDIEGACLDWSRAGELGDFEAYHLIKRFCNN